MRRLIALSLFAAYLSQVLFGAGLHHLLGCHHTHGPDDAPAVTHHCHHDHSHHHAADCHADEHPPSHASVNRESHMTEFGECPVCQWFAQGQVKQLAAVNDWLQDIVPAPAASKCVRLPKRTPLCFHSRGPPLC